MCAIGYSVKHIVVWQRLNILLCKTNERLTHSQPIEFSMKSKKNESDNPIEKVDVDNNLYESLSVSRKYIYVITQR